VFINASNQRVENTSIPDKLIPILQYIEDNIDKDLSLDVLEHSFYIDKFYLSRLFKKVTGSNLHEFILYKRISRAKQLLSNGNSAIEACALSGFNDYSNFHRIFKRTVGVSPGKYKK
jgi:YesN/AraC family two-component response regulator